MRFNLIVLSLIVFSATLIVLAGASDISFSLDTTGLEAFLIISWNSQTVPKDSYHVQIGFRETEEDQFSDISVYTNEGFVEKVCLLDITVDTTATQPLNVPLPKAFVNDQDGFNIFVDDALDLDARQTSDLIQDFLGIPYAEGRPTGDLQTNANNTLFAFYSPSGDVSAIPLPTFTPRTLSFMGDTVTVTAKLDDDDPREFTLNIVGGGAGDCTGRTCTLPVDTVSYSVANLEMNIVGEPRADFTPLLGFPVVMLRVDDILVARITTLVFKDYAITTKIRGVEHYMPFNQEYGPNVTGYSYLGAFFAPEGVRFRLNKPSLSNDCVKLILPGDGTSLTIGVPGQPVEWKHTCTERVEEVSFLAESVDCVSETGDIVDGCTAAIAPSVSSIRGTVFTPDEATGVFPAEAKITADTSKGLMNVSVTFTTPDAQDRKDWVGVGNTIQACFMDALKERTVTIIRPVNKQGSQRVCAIRVDDLSDIDDVAIVRSLWTTVDLQGPVTTVENSQIEFPDGPGTSRQQLRVTFSGTKPTETTYNTYGIVAKIKGAVQHLFPSSFKAADNSVLYDLPQGGKYNVFFGNSPTPLTPAPLTVLPDANTNFAAQGALRLSRSTTKLAAFNAEVIFELPSLVMGSVSVGFGHTGATKPDFQTLPYATLEPIGQFSESASTRTFATTVLNLPAGDIYSTFVCLGKDTATSTGGDCVLAPFTKANTLPTILSATFVSSARLSLKLEDAPMMVSADVLPMNGDCEKDSRPIALKKVNDAFLGQFLGIVGPEEKQVKVCLNTGYRVLEYVSPTGDGITAPAFSAHLDIVNAQFNKPYEARYPYSMTIEINASKSLIPTHEEDVTHFHLRMPNDTVGLFPIKGEEPAVRVEQKDVFEYKIPLSGMNTFFNNLLAVSIPENGKWVVTLGDTEDDDDNYVTEWFERHETLAEQFAHIADDMAPPTGFGPGVDEHDPNVISNDAFVAFDEATKSANMPAVFETKFDQRSFCQKEKTALVTRTCTVTGFAPSGSSCVLSAPIDDPQHMFDCNHNTCEITVPACDEDAEHMEDVYSAMRGALVASDGSVVPVMEQDTAEDELTFSLTTNFRLQGAAVDTAVPIQQGTVRVLPTQYSVSCEVLKSSEKQDTYVATVGVKRPFEAGQLSLASLKLKGEDGSDIDFKMAEEGPFEFDAGTKYASFELQYVGKEITIKSAEIILNIGENAIRYKHYEQAEVSARGKIGNNDSPGRHIPNNDHGKKGSGMKVAEVLVYCGVIIVVIAGALIYAKRKPQVAYQDIK